MRNQSVDELTRGVGAAFFIRGVLDSQMMFVLKASFNRPKGADGKIRDIAQLSKAEARQLYDTNTYFAPLWNTRFLAESRALDQDIQIIKNYLEKHPERWGVPALQLIEDAMLESLAVARHVSRSGKARQYAHSVNRTCQPAPIVACSSPNVSRSPSRFHELAIS